jgi:hypothetical protein
MAMRLPIGEITATVWRDAIRVVQTYPVIWIVSLVVSSLISTVSRSSEIKALTAEAWIFSRGWFLDGALSFVALLVLVPAALASHRFVVLGSYESLSRIFVPLRRFYFYAALEVFIIVGLMVPLGLMFSTEKIENNIISGIIFFCIILLILTVFWLMVRLAATYPAIALDADTSGLNSAFRATRGQVWRILAITLLTAGPVILGNFALSFVFPEESAGGLIVPSRFLSELVTGISVLLWVVLMSNVYLNLIHGDARATN